MSAKDFKLLLIRAVVTFVEGALAFWAVSGNRLDKTVLAGAIAAGLSALYNLARKYYPQVLTLGVSENKAPK